MGRSFRNVCALVLLGRQACAIHNQVENGASDSFTEEDTPTFFTEPAGAGWPNNNGSIQTTTRKDLSLSELSGGYCEHIGAYPCDEIKFAPGDAMKRQNTGIVCCRDQASCVGVRGGGRECDPNKIVIPTIKPIDGQKAYCDMKDIHLPSVENYLGKLVIKNEVTGDGFMQDGCCCTDCQTCAIKGKSVRTSNCFPKVFKCSSKDAPLEKKRTYVGLMSHIAQKLWTDIKTPGSQSEKNIKRIGTALGVLKTGLTIAGMLGLGASPAAPLLFGLMIAGAAISTYSMINAGQVLLKEECCFKTCKFKNQATTMFLGVQSLTISAIVQIGKSMDPTGTGFLLAEGADFAKEWTDELLFAGGTAIAGGVLHREYKTTTKLCEWWEARHAQGGECKKTGNDATDLVCEGVPPEALGIEANINAQVVAVSNGFESMDMEEQEREKRQLMEQQTKQ